MLGAGGGVGAAAIKANANGNANNALLNIPLPEFLISLRLSV